MLNLNSISSYISKCLSAQVSACSGATGSQHLNHFQHFLPARSSSKWLIFSSSLVKYEHEHKLLGGDNGA